jgi:Restriction endonuclease
VVDLLARFKALEAYVDKTDERARAGYAFEQLLHDLFRGGGLEVRPPGARDIDQVDGAVRLDGTWCLIEAKWRVGRSDVQSLDHFHQSVMRSFKTTRGFFFAYAGFTSNAIAAAGQFSPRSIILADGEDVRAAVEERIAPDQLLRKKVEAAEVEGRIYRLIFTHSSSSSSPSTGSTSSSS